MSVAELDDLLDHIRKAATEACGFVEGMSREALLADKRTQHAVTMCLLIIGEAATKVITRYPDFVARRETTQWRNVRGMRNRIAHGYFEIDIEIVWETVQTALPGLLATLPKR